jgi:hypothetical protein
MNKSTKSKLSSAQNSKGQKSIEEISEILCKAIKRYIALPAAVKNS